MSNISTTISPDGRERYKVFQLFYISEFQGEEAWLKLMHQEGWKLYDIQGLHYYFEPCSKEEWIYQLDFKEKDMIDDSYIQMYADYGWEYVVRFRQWYYFRKKKTASVEEDLSIFSDSDSRIEMCRQVIWHHTRLIVGILGCIMAFFGLLLFLNPQSNLIHSMFVGAWIGCLFGAAFTFNQFKHLKRMIRKLKSPVV